MKSIWDSLQLFQNHLIPLATLILPFAIVLEVFDAYYFAHYMSDPPLYEETFPLLLLHLLIQPFYSVAIIFYLASVIANKTMTTSQAWLLSLRYWPSYLLLSLILSLFIAAGAMLFILPGIFLFIRFLFAEFYLLLEQQSPFDAIRSSLINTKNYGLILFTGFIIIGIFTYGPFLVIDKLIDNDNTNNVNVLNIITNIVFDIVTIIFTIFTFRIYHVFKEKEAEQAV